MLFVVGLTGTPPFPQFSKMRNEKKNLLGMIIESVLATKITKYIENGNLLSR